MKYPLILPLLLVKFPSPARWWPGRPLLFSEVAWEAVAAFHGTHRTWRASDGQNEATFLVVLAPNGEKAMYN